MPTLIEVALTMLSTYAGYNSYARDLTASLKRTAAQPDVKSDMAYYNANIGKVKTVDDFIGNFRLYSYAMKAYGLDDMLYGKSFMKKVLESDLSSTSSFVNKLNDPRYRQFASTFNFAKNGKLADTSAAQLSTQEDDTIGLYTAKMGDNSAAAVIETIYYKDHIGAVKSVGDLIGDQRLFDFVTAAYGIKSDAASGSALASVLESNASDPNSYAAGLATSGTASVTLPLLAQSPAEQQSTTAAYAKSVGTTGAALTETTYYNKTIGTIGSIDQFMSNPRLVDYAKKAYGLTDASITPAVLRKVLTSDLTDPTSVANQLGSKAKSLAAAFTFSTQDGPSPYLKMAEDFNFGTDGNIAQRRSAQSTVDALGTELAYSKQSGTTSAARTKANVETTYYQTAIKNVTSLDDFMSDSRLVAYVTKAYGVDKANPSADTLRKVLTSDLTDPKSVANKLGPAYRALAAAFNFTTKGTIADATPRAQSKKDALLLGDAYTRLSLETQAGEQNEGVRLALYFQRVAPTLTNSYGILADKALLKVVQTALGLPSTSTASVDAQAKLLDKRLKIADLKDPKKLDRFIAQFSGLYDLSTNSSNATANVMALFGQ